MNEQADFLKRLIDKLSASNIPFMLVGSVAASYHGHPRSTFDIDLVVEAGEEALCCFARSLGEGYYVDEDSIREAFRNRSAFNIIDEATGFKADLIVRKERPFSQTEFGRRVSVHVMDRAVELATPEDVILSKLEWSKIGASERQFADALQVARSQGQNLDLPYIEKWSKELSVADLWNKIQKVLSER
jgi:hypothetical protein